MGFHLLAWAVVVVLAGLWSLLCWVGHAVLTWDGWAKGLDWATAVPELTLPPWLEEMLGLQWVNWARELLISWGPSVHGAMSSLPDLSGWAGGLVWITWGIGTALLLLLGAAASVVIALVRRKR